MARYAYGLTLPSVRSEFELSELVLGLVTVLGLVAAISLLAAVALVVRSRLT